MRTKNVIVSALCIGFSLCAGSFAFAQDTASQPGTSDEDIRLFRRDVRALKKQIVAANMDFTETEAPQFWPIYDKYATELAAITDKKFALLKEYSQSYDSISGEQAEAYVKGRAEVEQSITTLRMKYFPIFRKVLSGQATARFFQIDWRLGLIMDLQLMQQIPIVEP